MRDGYEITLMAGMPGSPIPTNQQIALGSLTGENTCRGTQEKRIYPVVMGDMNNPFYTYKSELGCSMPAADIVPYIDYVSYGLGGPIRINENSTYPQEVIEEVGRKLRLIQDDSAAGRSQRTFR